MTCIFCHLIFIFSILHYYLFLSLSATRWRDGSGQHVEYDQRPDVFRCTFILFLFYRSLLFFILKFLYSWYCLLLMVLVRFCSVLTEEQCAMLVYMLI